MTRTTDFADAHLRHGEDAELLFGSKRFGGADHLYGLSAECGLKAVMERLGMEVDAAGTPKDPHYKKHIHELWPIFEDFIQNRKQARFRLPPGKPFADWSHHDRYAPRSRFEEGSVDRHRLGAKMILPLVERARLELEPPEQE